MDSWQLNLFARTSRWTWGDPNRGPKPWTQTVDPDNPKAADPGPKPWTQTVDPNRNFSIFWVARFRFTFSFNFLYRNWFLGFSSKTQKIEFFQKFGPRVRATVWGNGLVHGFGQQFGATVWVHGFGQRFGATVLGPHGFGQQFQATISNTKMGQWLL